MNTVKAAARNHRTWLGVTIAALVGGNIVGWGTTFIEVKNYCDELGFGALTDFSGDLVENPLLTPCFWGSIVFAISLAWAIKLWREKDIAKFKAQFRWLLLLLIAGTLFAAVNNYPIFDQFYTDPDSAVSCSNGKVSSPFLTSCFFGFAAYFTAMLAGFAADKTTPKDPKES